MPLRYRGVFYDYQSATLETTEGEQVGRYRGAKWISPMIRPMDNPQPFRIPGDRGILYIKGTVSPVRTFSEVE